MQYLSITEAQQKLLELPDEMITQPIIITKNGKPVMVAMSYEEFESLTETISILSDDTFAQKLQESIIQGERKETLSWEKVSKALD